MPHPRFTVRVLLIVVAVAGITFYTVEMWRRWRAPVVLARTLDGRAAREYAERIADELRTKHSLSAHVLAWEVSDKRGQAVVYIDGPRSLAEAKALCLKVRKIKLKTYNSRFGELPDSQFRRAVVTSHETLARLQDMGTELRLRSRDQFSMPALSPRPLPPTDSSNRN